MTSLALLAAVLAAASAPTATRAAAIDPARRAAIVVGASAPVPGRPLLRHAHHDADVIADVLSTVGGFERARVHVLHDPEPAALLAVVEREAAALAGIPQAMLFFYYSGHAGDGALFTAGKPVPVDALRRALDRADVSVRIGVLDACHGGEWTRAKGLVPDAPFEVPLPPLLAAEGSALIASSSGAESAHESDALGGSFFTHHFAAALRGAADAARHGEVTLGEAFEYARAQTIRETARVSRETQHPSFALNLRGRQDVVLAQTAQSPSTLAVKQADGPLEVIHLGSGLRMVELPPGSRSVVLAVPAGRYLVRKVSDGGVLAREVPVPRDGSAYVQEHELVLVATDRLALKGDRPRGTPGDWPERGGGELEIGLETTEKLGLGWVGIGTGDDVGNGGMLRLDARIGITDRLAWKVGTLALAYRLGERGGVEVAPYAGLLSWKMRFAGDGPSPQLGGFYGGDKEWRIGAGVGMRAPFAVGAFVFTFAADRATIGQETGNRFQVGLGLTLNAGSKLAFHLSAGVSRYDFPELVVDTIDPINGFRSVRNYGGQATVTWIGSPEFGLASLPLVRVGPFGGFSLNLYAGSERYRPIWYRAGIARTF
jgi:caspase domain-containing protein